MSKFVIVGLDLDAGYYYDERNERVTFTKEVDVRIDGEVFRAPLKFTRQFQGVTLDKPVPCLKLELGGEIHKIFLDGLLDNGDEVDLEVSASCLLSA